MPMSRPTRSILGWRGTSRPSGSQASLGRHTHFHASSCLSSGRVTATSGQAEMNASAVHCAWPSVLRDRETTSSSVSIGANRRRCAVDERWATHGKALRGPAWNRSLWGRSANPTVLTAALVPSASPFLGGDGLWDSLCPLAFGTAFVLWPLTALQYGYQ